MAKKNKNSTPAVTAAGGGITKKSRNIIIVSAAVAFAIIVGVLVWALFPSYEFDFYNPDIKRADPENEKKLASLSEYISISAEDYKNYPVSAVLDEYSADHLARKINKLLVENKSKDAEYDGLATTKVEITLGDVVEIYYRGYTVDKNGVQTEFAGGSNFTDDEPSELEIGSGSFIPGFEEALIGKKPADTEKFSRITEGKVEENYVVYISYFSSAAGYGYYERVDLSEDIDKTYGKGFRDYLLAAEIGVKCEAKVFELGEGKSAGYQDLTVNYATSCESNPLTIDVKFPNNYHQEDLRGVNAKFDVYIERATIYNTEEFDENFITKTLGVKPEEIASYAGDDLVAKYKNFLIEEIKDEIEKANNELILEDMWTYLKKKVTVHALPEDVVTSQYNTYYNEIVAYYNDNAGQFDSIDDCAIYRLGLSTGADWRAHIKNKATDTVTEKAIFFYIIIKENIIPTEEEYEALSKEIYQERLDAYLEYYKSETEDLDKDAYDKYVEDLKADLDAEYTKEYLREIALYEYATDKLVSYAQLGSAVK